jgi:hypothetical protein
MKTHHGRHYGAGVDVEEEATRRPLDPRLDLGNHCLDVDQTLFHPLVVHESRGETPAHPPVR